MYIVLNVYVCFYICVCVHVYVDFTQYKPEILLSFNLLPFNYQVITFLAVIVSNQIRRYD